MCKGDLLFPKAQFLPPATRGVTLDTRRRTGAAAPACWGGSACLRQWILWTATPILATELVCHAEAVAWTNRAIFPGVCKVRLAIHANGTMVRRDRYLLLPFPAQRGFTPVQPCNTQERKAQEGAVGTH